MDITAAIITAFRAKHPAFSVSATWPDSVLTTALCEGDAESGGTRWGGYVDECNNLKQRGMFLFAAHWLSTTYPSGAVDVTAQSGSANNIVAAKSVGDESVTFAQPVITTLGDGWLGSTSYGQQFIRLRRRVGMGAVAL